MLKKRPQNGQMFFFMASALQKIKNGQFFLIGYEMANVATLLETTVGWSAFSSVLSARDTPEVIMELETKFDLSSLSATDGHT